MKKLFVALNLVLLSLWSCKGEKEGNEDVTLPPTLKVSVVEAEESSVAVSFAMENAEEIYYNFKEDDNQAFDESELMEGKKLTQSKTIIIEGLTPKTEYVLSAIAVSGSEKTEIKTVTFTTKEILLPTVELSVSDIAQSSVLITYTLKNATAMYLNYRVNTGDITEEELLESGKAYETVTENVMGLTPDTEYIVGAMAIDENTGEKSEVVTLTFKTLSPATDDKVSFEGDFILARLQYRGAVNDYPELGLYEGVFVSTEKLTMDASGFLFPDFEQPVGLLIKINAFADYVDSDESFVPTICGEYTISKDEVAKYKIDQYTGNSYVSTMNNGTPALYMIESGTMTVEKDGDSYKYDFDFTLQNADDENEEPKQLKYSYVGSEEYDNTTILAN